MHKQLRCFDEDLIIGDLCKEGWLTIQSCGSGACGTRFAMPPIIEVFAEHKPMSKDGGDVREAGRDDHEEYEGKMLIRQTGGLDI
jgi:hypothetical protein